MRLTTVPEPTAENARGIGLPVEIPLTYREDGTYRGLNPAANLKK
jgi:hypothetical protein